MERFVILDKYCPRGLKVNIGFDDAAKICNRDWRYFIAFFFYNIHSLT